MFSWNAYYCFHNICIVFNAIRQDNFLTLILYSQNGKPRKLSEHHKYFWNVIVLQEKSQSGVRN